MPQEQIERIAALGYTESEARFGSGLHGGRLRLSPLLNASVWPH